MKSKIAILLNVALITLALNAEATTAPSSQDVVIGLNDIFVPGGFDSTSDAFVVVNGIFPNGCYKWKGSSRKDLSNFEHEITSMATVSSGMCIQVLIPFTKDIRLGKLDMGTHILRFKSNDGTYIQKNLVVE